MFLLFPHLNSCKTVSKKSHYWSNLCLNTSIVTTVNAGVGCHSLLQETSPIQGLNPGLLHCRQILYCLSHQGSS